MKQFIAFVVSIFTASLLPAQEKVDVRDLLELRGRLDGFFTNELQAKADTGYRYMEWHGATIWERSEDGYWLYVEEKLLPSADNNPTHQYIFHFTRQDDITLVNTIFELRDPLRFAGAYNNPDLLNGQTKDSLILQKGCAVYLYKNTAGNYLGSTPGKDCPGNIHGAAYITTLVTVYEDKFICWDRGWDKDDKQVWGTTRGGYQFIKK